MLQLQIYRPILVCLFQNVTRRNLHFIPRVHNILEPTINTCGIPQNAFISPVYSSLRFYAKGKDKKKEKGID